MKTTPYIVYYNGKRSLCQGKIIHLNPIKQKQPLKNKWLFNIFSHKDTSITIQQNKIFFYKMPQNKNFEFIWKNQYNR